MDSRVRGNDGAKEAVKIIFSNLVLNFPGRGRASENAQSSILGLDTSF